MVKMHIGRPLLSKRMVRTWLIVACVITLVSAQQGFLSLDCGATTSWKDVNGIEWTPDDDYVKTGITTSISKDNMVSANREVQRLRYFPEALKKHCYLLPVIAGKQYIVRPTFYYGNYDALNQLNVTFDIVIGANTFITGCVCVGKRDIVTVNITGQTNTKTYYELIVKTEKDILDFCLATSIKNSSSSVPFISALELRKLDPGMYNLSDSTQALVLFRRIDLGAASTHDIRYPSDQYDRIWNSDLAFKETNKDMIQGNYTTISSTSTFTSTFLERAPSAVLQTAITSDTSIRFQFPVTLPPVAYRFMFYFAEFAALRKNKREFYIVLNTSSSVAPVLDRPVNILDNTNGITTSSVEVYSLEPVDLGSPAVFVFSPTSDSNFGPVLNAAELLRVMGNLSSGTDTTDISAILNIRSQFNISGWFGDPCLPTPYTWDWITCDTSQASATITELNLSNRQLQGSIPESITSLVHLRKIYLDNNNLQGPIPDLTPLRNLTTLHLDNNHFRGAFPSFLLKMHQLQNLTIQNNTFDCVPEEFSSSFNTSTNQVQVCSKESTNRIGVIVGVIVGALVLLIIIAVGVWFFCIKKLTKISEIQNQTDLPLNLLEHPAPKAPMASRSFSYKEMVEVTDSFKTKIGQGGFGPVYYGRLADGLEVAVKLLSAHSSQGLREFNAEINVLSVVHHRNLVSFIGFCNEGSKLMLVYEYLHNGTLREHLIGGTKSSLSWRKRLDIALDAAQGLDYLHTACNLHIIHRDVKSTNILLNSSLVAKVTDFGLSKLYDMNDATHVSTVVKGSIGYLDPEYHISGRLTSKSDVFSFGIVLFEIVCGREPINLNLNEDEIVLAKWAAKELVRGNIRRVMDCKMETYSEQAAWKVVELAMACVEADSVNRPHMSTVVAELKEAIQLEESGSMDQLTQLSLPTQTN